MEAEVRGEPGGAGRGPEGEPQPQHGALQAEELLRGGPGAPGGPEEGQQEPAAWVPPRSQSDCCCCLCVPEVTGVVVVVVVVHVSVGLNFCLFICLFDLF